MNRERLSIRHIDKKKIIAEMQKINNVMAYVPIDNITELNDTFFVSAAIVTKRLVKNKEEREEPLVEKEVEKEGS